MSARVPIPASIDVKFRRMDFELPHELPLHWFGQSAFLTHFFNAMSSVFPEGEKFFIDSVRHFEAQIEDPELRGQIKDFVRQEGHHTFQHRVLNDLVRSQGFPITKYEAFVRGLLDRGRQINTPLQQLATTAALEHFTAIMGDDLLRHPEGLSGADPRVSPLWFWHAVEETEHKGVAFDVYEAVGGDYWTRVRAMVMATLMFFPMLHVIQISMLKHDPNKLSLKDVAQGVNYLWGKPGFLRRIVPRYVQWYRRDFHPWQHDNSGHVAAWTRSNARYVVAEPEAPTAA